MFAGPAFGIVLVFYLVPLLLNVVLSFFAWTAFRPELRWSGLGNYRDLNEEGVLAPTVLRSLVYAAVASALAIVGPLLLALALERPSRANRLLRTIFFAPVLLSPLAVGFVFNALLGLDGTVNHLFSAIAAHPVAIPWLASKDVSLFVISVAVAWRWGPLLFVVLLAGLAAIPRELLDAARIDGAGAWTAFRHVRFPLLAPAVTFGTVIALITALSAYEIPYVLTGGGPGRNTQVLNYLVVYYFGDGRFGAAAATSTVLFGAIFICCLPLIARLRQREVDL
jgi:raffinose/stachyose/melibiose transport system permease protein